MIVQAKPVSKCCGLRISYTVVFEKSTMMRSIIKSSTDGESKAFWQSWNQIITEKGFEFIQQSAPLVAAPCAQKSSELPGEAAADPDADYTKECDLRALLAQPKLLPDHKTYCELLISLNCTEFFAKYFADDCDHGFDKFLAQKGEQNIVPGAWQDPKPDETAKLTNLTGQVQKVKKISVDM